MAVRRPNPFSLTKEGSCPPSGSDNRGPSDQLLNVAEYKELVVPARIAGVPVPTVTEFLRKADQLGHVRTGIKIAFSEASRRYPKILY